MKKSLLALAALPLFAFSGNISAATIDFSYNTVGGNDLVWGTKKAETYDVAILIKDESLVGSKVTGLKVLLPLEKDQVETVSAWMSKELKIVDRVNAPDILSDEVDFAGEYIDIKFSEAYTITDEGVYVGYSFTIPKVNNADANDLCKTPVAVQYGDNENGFWFHSSRSQLKWKNQQKVLGAVSAMVVSLEGDFYNDAAGIKFTTSNFIGKKEKTAAVTISNHGATEIKSIEYTSKIGDATYSGTYNFNPAISGIFNMTQDVQLPVAIPDAVGAYPAEITITKVNGVENLDKMRTLTGTAQVIPLVPVNRPLVEEYTGLWCGWCPRGYVALETMNDKYPGEFIGFAWHNGDDMTITSRYPNSVSGFPYGFINRKDGMDPGYFEQEWPKYRTEIPIGDVNVDLQWANEEHTAVKATAKTTFIAETDDSYKLSFALLLDGLNDKNWAQSNNYVGRNDLEGKYAELFTKGKSKVKGLDFNDVVGYYPSSEFFGVDGSLPETVEAGKTYETEYIVEIADIVNSKKKNLTEYLKDPTHMRVVAIIFNDKKEFINCASSGYIGMTGVQTITDAATDIVSTTYYDMNGRKIANPDKGIYIKAETLSNGKIRTTKIAR